MQYTLCTHTTNQPTKRADKACTDAQALSACACTLLTSLMTKLNWTDVMKKMGAHRHPLHKKAKQCVCVCVLNELPLFFSVCRSRWQKGRKDWKSKQTITITATTTLSSAAVSCDLPSTDLFSWYCHHHNHHLFLFLLLLFPHYLYSRNKQTDNNRQCHWPLSTNCQKMVALMMLAAKTVSLASRLCQSRKAKNDFGRLNKHKTANDESDDYEDDKIVKKTKAQTKATNLRWGRETDLSFSFYLI